MHHNCTTMAAAAAAAKNATTAPHDTVTAKALLLLQSQLQTLQACSRQQLAAAGAGCAAKVAEQREALLDSLCAALQRQRQRCLLARCWLVWLQSHQHAQILRTTALSAAVRVWHQRAHAHASTARRIAVFRRRHLQRVLRAWQWQSTQQCGSEAWAGRWAAGRRQRQAFALWRQLAQRTQDLLDGWQAQRATLQLQLLVRAWHQQTARQQQAAYGRKAGVVDGWAAATQRSRRLLACALRVWRELPLVRLRLRAIGAAVARVHRQQLLAAGLASFTACSSEGRQARRTCWRCFAEWSAAAATSAALHARSQRLLHARTTARRRHLLRTCLRAWLTEACRAARCSDRGQARALHASLVAQAAALTAAEEQLEALRAYAHDLQLAASQAVNLAAPELPLAPSLVCSVLQPASLALQARARHATLRLEALQAASAAGCPAGLLGCLVVVGGVGAGNSWLEDVSLLAVCYSSGDITGKAQPLPVAASSSLDSPVWPVRDFAACACGPAAFVVVGGFHGAAAEQESHQLEMHMCVLQRPPAAHESAETAAAAAAAAAAEAATPSGWLSGWRGTWQALQPRAHNRAPPARSLHSATFDAPSNSIVVFGGWASGQGCLNEVHVFHLQHREWWQPPPRVAAPHATTHAPCSAQSGAAAPAWPCARRSHAAVAARGALFVHGGLDASGCHLGDLWQLDLRTWTWQQLAPPHVATTASGSMPAPRRAHAMEAVCGGRFLLLHGGYAGHAELLGDAWAWDTRCARWLPVELALQGAPASAAHTLAGARALHTLTEVGPHVLLVGGHGAAGLCGPRDSVGLLASPAVLHAQQLQKGRQQASQQVQAMRQLAAMLQGEVTAARSDLQRCAVQAADEARRRAAMEQQQAGLASEVCSLQRQLSAAKEQAKAAAASEVAALTRRLARARAAGLQACTVAAALKQ